MGHPAFAGPESEAWDKRLSNIPGLKIQTWDTPTWMELYRVC